MRTGVEKRYGELNALLARVRSALDDDEWANLLKSMNELYAAVSKVRHVEERVPSEFFAVLVAIEDAHSEISKDKSKKKKKKKKK